MTEGFFLRSFFQVVGKDGASQKTYSYTDYGETTEQGENNFYNEICYGGGVYDKTTGLYYLNARYYSPENGSFLTQDTYRGSRSKGVRFHRRRSSVRRSQSVQDLQDGEERIQSL